MNEVIIILAQHTYQLPGGWTAEDIASYCMCSALYTSYSYTYTLYASWVESCMHVCYYLTSAPSKTVTI